MLFLAGRQRWFFILALFVIGLYVHARKINTSIPNPWTGAKKGAVFSWKDLPLKHPKDAITPLPKEHIQTLPNVQFDFLPEHPADQKLRETRQHAVKTAFTRSWASYRKFAWKSDELRPKSGEAKNSYAGWGASLVDNLDTLWIMGMKRDFKAAVKASMQIRFDVSTESDVNIFETTIRYLGGFLSAYDLSGDKRLLRKATELGDMILVAFDTPNHLPVTRWRMSLARVGGTQQALGSAVLAEIGSLSLELTRLAQVTGDDRYYSAIETITTIFSDQQNQTSLPGLWPTIVSANTANLTIMNIFTIGGLADSAYEYLPKMHSLLGGADARYRTMYSSFATTALRTIIRKPLIPHSRDTLVPIDATAAPDGELLLNQQTGHLSCFSGGMFALAGRLLSLPSHVDIGSRLTEFCLWAYHATPTGVMPESFTVDTCASDVPCEWNETRWRTAVARASHVYDLHGTDLELHISRKRLPKGFTSMGDRRYLLRPETVESLFVMYRVTGEKRWMDEAWLLFESIMAVSRTELANGEVVDVTVGMEEVETEDSMESFWMAETLKYLYLIFSEPGYISLDKYVFNTEAHPLLRPVVETSKV